MNQKGIIAALSMLAVSLGITFAVQIGMLVDTQASNEVSSVKQAVALNSEKVQSEEIKAEVSENKEFVDQTTDDEVAINAIDSSNKIESNTKIASNTTAPQKTNIQQIKVKTNNLN